MSAITAVLLLSVLAEPARAQSPASASGRFLNISIGARQAAMGEAGAGLADDLYAIYYNPAGLGQLIRREAGFIHTQYAEGITYEHLAYAQPTARWGTWGGSLALLNYGGIKGYDEFNTPTGNISASDSLLSLAWGGTPLAKSLPQLRAGLSAKFFQEKLASYSASAFAADLGLLYPVYELPDYSVSAGFAARNLGTQMKFVSESFNLPRTYVIGLGVKGWKQSTALAMDLNLPEAGSPSVKLGAELWTMNVLALRVGYQSGLDLGPGFSGGVGLKWGSFQLDYAIAPFGVFDYVHRVGVLVRFSGLTGNLYEQGVALMQKGRYVEAIDVFTRLLTAEPDSRQAVLRLKECQRALARELEKK